MVSTRLEQQPILALIHAHSIQSPPSLPLLPCLCYLQSVIMNGICTNVRASVYTKFASSASPGPAQYDSVSTLPPHHTIITHALQPQHVVPSYCMYPSHHMACVCVPAYPLCGLPCVLSLPVYTWYCNAARPKWVPLDAKHSPCAPQLPSIPLAPPSVATAAVTPLLQPTATRRRCQPLEDSQYHDVAPHVWHLFFFLSACWLQQCGVSCHSTNTTRSSITFAVTVCCCCYWRAACATFGRARRNGGKSGYTTPGPNAYNSGGTFGSRPHSASSSRLRRSPS